ncbi:MAG: EAL domain-containing protein, partial [Reyranella sp.]
SHQDRAGVRSRHHDKQGGCSITRFSVRLARELGLDVVAEGVETPEQLAKLKEWGCTGIQGYLISRPLPADELAPFLAAHGSPSKR